MMTKFTERSDVSFMSSFYPEANRPKDFATTRSRLAGRDDTRSECYPDPARGGRRISGQRLLRCARNDGNYLIQRDYGYGYNTRTG
jgi:hypothetical protein